GLFLLCPTLNEPIDRQPKQYQKQPEASLLRLIDNRRNDKRRRNREEQDRHHRITPRSIRAFSVWFAPPENENRGSNQYIEQRQRKDRVVGDAVVRAREDEDQDNRENTLNDQRIDRYACSRRHLRQALQRETILGQRVWHACCCEHRRVKSAEGRRHHGRGHQCYCGGSE